MGIIEMICRNIKCPGTTHEAVVRDSDEPDDGSFEVIATCFLCNNKTVTTVDYSDFEDVEK